MIDRIVQVVYPVSLCSIYTCILVRVLSWSLAPSQPNFLETTWRRLGIDVEGGVGINGSDVSGVDWESSLLIVLLISTLIVLVTLLILLILYMGWHQCLVYYFYLPSFIILTLVTPAFLRSILSALNLFAPDIYTVILVCWNFTALGMMAIFGLYAPTALCVQQFYLIHNSAMLSLLIIHALPGWAPWLLLAFLVGWDLFAVLAPYGPLNLIISMADRVGVTEMPGLVYSTQMVSHGQADAAPISEPHKQEQQRRSATSAGEKVGTPDTVSTSTPPTIASNLSTPERVAESPLQAIKEETTNKMGDEDTRAPDSSDIDQGLSIGLGDFIFYSLLVGLSSRGRNQADFYPVLATLVAVLFGLVITLFILALNKRALPALPISIALGLSMAALTSVFAAPLANQLAAQAIFV